MLFLQLIELFLRAAESSFRFRLKAQEEGEDFAFLGVVGEALRQGEADPLLIIEAGFAAHGFREAVDVVAAGVAGEIEEVRVEAGLHLAEALHVELAFGDLLEEVFFLDICGLVEVTELVERVLDAGGFRRSDGNFADE